MGHLSAGDAIIDAGRTIRLRKGKVFALGISIMLGIATYVVVQSMVASGNASVESRIAALRADTIQVSSMTPAAESDLSGALPRVAADPDVRGSVVLDERPSDHEVRSRLGLDSSQVVPARITGVEGTLSIATGSTIRGSEAAYGQGSDAHVAIVGASVADQMGLPTADSGATIWLDGLPFQVVGTYEDSDNYASGLTSVLIPRATANRILVDKQRATTIFVRTRRGRAEAVAQRLRLRLSPSHPDQWRADVIDVPLDVANAISRDVQTLGLVMAGQVLFLGIIAIGNAMMRSVYDRTHEIGLRRALGARASDILGLLLLEAATIGLVAGITGVLLGAGASIVISWINHWPVVLSASAVFSAAPIAVLAAVAGGLLPAIRAVRISPNEALRRD